MNAVIIDTEATDKDPKTSQVIELAELVVSETPRQFMSRILPFFAEEPAGRPTNALYSCTVPIKFGAMAAHNILPHELVGKPVFGAYTAPEGVGYLIGHNIDFDAELAKASDDLRRICTLAIARRLIPDCDAHSQSALLYYAAFHRNGEEGLVWARDRLKNSHRAADDVENCAVLLQFLLQILDDTNPGMLDSWETVHQFSEEARIPFIMGFGKHKGEPVRNLPWGYVSWYLKQPDQDPYLLKAFRRCGFIK